MCKIFCNQTQSRFCRKQVVFLGKILFQLFLLFRVKVCGFNRIENLVGNFWILEFLDFVGTIFVIERNCRTIFYGSLEIVNRNVAAESSFGDVVIFQKRSARKADTRSRRKQGTHVVCKNSILTAVRFVGHH